MWIGSVWSRRRGSSGLGGGIALRTASSVAGSVICKLWSKSSPSVSVELNASDPGDSTPEPTFKERIRCVEELVARVSGVSATDHHLNNSNF